MISIGRPIGPEEGKLSTVWGRLVAPTAWKLRECRTYSLKEEKKMKNWKEWAKEEWKRRLQLSITRRPEEEENKEQGPHHQKGRREEVLMAARGDKPLATSIYTKPPPHQKSGGKYSPGSLLHPVDGHHHQVKREARLASIGFPF